MTAAPPQPPPGWYPDPSGGPGQRYWDGTKWTDVNVPPSTPPIGPRNARRSTSPLKVLLIIGAVIFGLVGGCTACVAAIGHNSSTSTNSTSTPPSAATHSQTAAPTTTHNRDLDIFPSSDGIYRVSNGGVFSTGIEAGWYETHVRPGSRACTWERLSAPEVTIETTIEMRPAPDEPDTPDTVIQVVIQKTDYAFDSHGCEPWQKLEGQPAR